MPGFRIARATFRAVTRSIVRTMGASAVTGKGHHTDEAKIRTAMVARGSSSRGGARALVHDPDDALALAVDALVAAWSRHDLVTAERRLAQMQSQAGAR